MRIIIVVLLSLLTVQIYADDLMMEMMANEPVAKKQIQHKTVIRKIKQRNYLSDSKKEIKECSQNIYNQFLKNDPLNYKNYIEYSLKNISFMSKNCRNETKRFQKRIIRLLSYKYGEDYKGDDVLSKIGKSYTKYFKKFKIKNLSFLSEDEMMLMAKLITSYVYFENFKKLDYQNNFKFKKDNIKRNENHYIKSFLNCIDNNKSMVKFLVKRNIKLEGTLNNDNEKVYKRICEEDYNNVRDVFKQNKYDIVDILKYDEIISGDFKEDVLTNFVISFIIMLELDI